MKTLGAIIKSERVRLGLTMVELSGRTGIDQALISKYENGLRMPSDKHIPLLAKGIGFSESALRKSYLAEKVAELVKYELNPSEILVVAESRLEYLRSKRVFEGPSISKIVEDKLLQVDQLRDQWKTKRPSNHLHLTKLNEAHSVQYTYESNRIEGNTLSLQETHLVVNEGLTINGKNMTEHLEAINHMEAVGWIRELATGGEELTKRTVLTVHQLVLRAIDPENAGTFRKVPVRIAGSAHVPPQPYLLEKLMEDFFVHYETHRRLLHPVLLAAEVHERLVTIHPFIDGNGRTARLLMNFLLLRSGYTIAILKGDAQSRLAYYLALERVQMESDPEPFYLLILDKVIESLEEHLKMV